MASETMVELQRTLDDMVNRMQAVEDGWRESERLHRAETDALNERLRAAYKAETEARWVAQVQLHERQNAILERIAVALERGPATTQRGTPDDGGATPGEGGR